MHWLDSTLLALLAIGAVVGFMSGLLWQVARVVSLGVALWATLLFHEPAVKLVSEFVLQGADSNLIRVVAYAVVFLIVYFLLVLATKLVQKMVEASGFSWLDRCLGACLGVTKTAIILGGVCLLISRATNPSMQEWMTRCSIAPSLAHSTESALTLIPEDYKRSLADTLVTLRAKVDEPSAQ